MGHGGSKMKMKVKKSVHISRSLTVPDELFYHGMQICWHNFGYPPVDIDSLVHDCRNSSALAMKVQQSCT